MEVISVATIQQFLKEGHFELEPSQRRLCLPILKRIIDKLQRGARFTAIHVADGKIVNGHHRYISYTFLKLPIEITNWTKNQGQESITWDQVIIDEADWDTPEEIEDHERTSFP